MYCISVCFIIFTVDSIFKTKKGTLLSPFSRFKSICFSNFASSRKQEGLIICVCVFPATAFLFCVITFRYAQINNRCAPQRSSIGALAGMSFSFL